MKLDHLRRSIAAVLVACAGAAALAQDPKLDSGTAIPPEQACYDVLHYDLALTVDPTQRSINGRLTMRAKVLAKTDSILLDLDDRLKVAAVKVGSNDAKFEREEGRIRVRGLAEFGTVGAEFEIAIDYGGVPRVAPNPPWDGGFTWKTTKDGKPWIATSCQGEGADLWWPCKDQPDDEADTIDLHFTAPDPLFIASNGKLVGAEVTKPGWRTYHWHVSNPANNYTIAFCAAPYTKIEGNFRSIAGEVFPIVFYVLPEHEEQGKKLFVEMQEDLAFFESVCGPYPFRADKYGVVETPHLGMEQQTITGYGNNFRGNPWGKDEGFDFLLHHEMSHEWWGLLVTAKNWNDFWIHEGIGTYMQALYAEKRRGVAGYKQVMSEQRAGLRNRGPVAPRELHSSQEMYFTSKWSDSPAGDIYNKGSWIMHTLRYVLGDKDFFRVLRRFAYPDAALEKLTDGKQCRFATTDELLAIANRESGLDLAWFWELYLRQPALPRLDSEVKDGELHLKWITPNGLACPIPVEVEVGGKLTKVEMKNGEGSLALHGAKDFRIDPNDRVLRELPPRENPTQKR